MKTNSRFLPWLLSLIVIVAVLIGLQTPAPVQAGPVAQDTRPPAGGDGGGGGGGGDESGGGGQGDGPVDARCASLRGQVINWGFGPEGDVVARLETGSWQLSTLSASDGSYGFGGLGIGLATLRVELAPGQPLQPLVQDAGIYLNCDYPFVANIALAGDPDVQPPATIEVTAGSSLLAPGTTAAMTLQVENTLPNDITNVVVTAWIPQGVNVESISPPAGFPAGEVVEGGADGRLLVVNLGRVTSGAAVPVGVTVRADPALPAEAPVGFTATLFYAESAADQDTFVFNTGEVGAPVPAPAAVAPTATPPPAEEFAPPTATPQPAAVETPAAPEPTPDTGVDTVPPNGMPTTGEDLIPPHMLPVTGENADTMPVLSRQLPQTGLGTALPLGWLGLVLVLVLVRFLRSSRPD